MHLSDITIGLYAPNILELFTTCQTIEIYENSSVVKHMLCKRHLLHCVDRVIIIMFSFLLRSNIEISMLYESFTTECPNEIRDVTDTFLIRLKPIFFLRIITFCHIYSHFLLV